MIWLIRHTKRLLTKQDKWLNSRRYKENNVDMPITTDGKEYVKQAVIEMMSNDKNYEKRVSALLFRDVSAFNRSVYSFGFTWILCFLRRSINSDVPYYWSMRSA